MKGTHKYLSKKRVGHRWIYKYKKVEGKNRDNDDDLSSNSVKTEINTKIKNIVNSKLIDKTKRKRIKALIDNVKHDIKIASEAIHKYNELKGYGYNDGEIQNKLKDYFKNFETDHFADLYMTHSNINEAIKKYDSMVGEIKTYIGKLDDFIGNPTNNPNRILIFF